MSGATSVDDDDIMSESADSVLNLVMWLSLLFLQNITGTQVVQSMTTTRTQGRPIKRKKKITRKTRRQMHTNLFPLQVCQEFSSAVINDMPINPRRSMWYYVYVMHPQVDNARFQAVFCRLVVSDYRTTHLFP